MRSAVAAVLAGWFCVSAAAQIRPLWLQWLRRYDLFCLVPRWNFFAPVPGTEDLVLLYREQVADGPMTYWMEVPRERTTRYLSAVWNPGRRQNKALFDACQQLAIGVEDLRRRNLPPAFIEVSIPYILLVNYVASLPPVSVGARRQFMVMRSTGLDGQRRPLAIFVSGPHRVEVIAD